MTFMLKKKKYKFQVDVLIEELTAVPFVNAILFAKIRLLDGGSFCEISSREEVADHCVKWNSQFAFCCKMSANASTGVLDPCICRVSIRKEVKGGRSFQKLGFADLNLVEYAGQGVTSRRYLLEGYDTRHRQDNSVLKVSLGMTLLSGDPCFKAPSTLPPPLPNEAPELHVAVPKGDDYSGSSIASSSSGFGSLPRTQRPTIVGPGDGSSGDGDGKKEEGGGLDFEQCHSRNSSYTSQQSRGSGYGSLPSHSRQGSSDSGHIRNLSSGSGYSDTFPGSLKPPDRKRPTSKVQNLLHKQITEEHRMDSTRVNADQLIEDLLRATNLEDDSAEDSGTGLQLFIGEDGIPALGTAATVKAGSS
ncbi:early estrogen-induced gene 1 protein-like [Ornithodoros turicata]|uniref:C2 NT-type domain-containing protein n=1 Tax=Ornithodoros turicata TaxID=34597 RepID=A0A2R5L6Z8_9ACAR